MLDFNDYGPVPRADEMSQWLEQSHLLTLSLLDDLTPEMLALTQRATVNLPLWEFGHVGWFSELWIHRHGDTKNISILPGSDELYDSSNVEHATRWNLQLPDRQQTRNFLLNVFEKTQALLKSDLDVKTAYFIQLAIYHQDMHNEAFAYTRQSVGYALPLHVKERFDQKKNEAEALNQSLTSTEDLHFAANSLNMGAHRGEGFFFDNEKWSHRVELAAFSISPQMVKNQDILNFVVSTNNVLVPAYWTLIDDVWYERKFDQWLTLDPAAIAVHVSYDLASAYCEWANRRLPTEAEWFCLRSSPAFEAGFVTHSFVWEWTATEFASFEGFSTDPYRDYSAPWMDGFHQVLRGASWMTPDRLKRPGYRNFYMRNRSDIFCGFRTCAK